MKHIRESRWLSLEDLTEYLGIKKSTVYKLIKRKGMPAYKARKLWKFLKKEIDEWMLSGRAGEADSNNDFTH